MAFGIVLDGRPLPFDFDSDGDVDLADYGRFHVCFNGSEPQSIAKACGLGDFDADSDIDLTDLGAFLTYFGIASVTPVPANPYYFTGRELDFDLRDATVVPLLALYHYRARAYDPWHGRFCQRDPLLYIDSRNLYEFVLSNPMAGVDPSGQLLFIGLLTDADNRPLLMAALLTTGIAAQQFVGAVVEALLTYNIGVELQILATEASLSGAYGASELLYHAGEASAALAAGLIYASTRNKHADKIAKGLKDVVDDHLIKLATEPPNPLDPNKWWRDILRALGNIAKQLDRMVPAQRRAWEQYIKETLRKIPKDVNVLDDLLRFL